MNKYKFIDCQVELVGEKLFLCKIYIPRIPSDLKTVIIPCIVDG